MSIGIMPPHARAILWAQFRAMRNRLPRANKLGLAFTALVGAFWYGAFVLGAFGIAMIMASDSSLAAVDRILPGGLLLAFLYWLVIPVLMASKGTSLELRKLLVYPIRSSEFFRLEMLLRLSVGVEPLLLICGAFAGLMFNRSIPAWGPPALLVFALFTMFFAMGTHDLLGRLMMRKGVREIAALLFLLALALPQLLVTRARPSEFRWIDAATSWTGWPWAAAARIGDGHGNAGTIAILLAWTAAAYAFGRWQFERSLRFDASDAGAPRIKSEGRGWIEWFYRWPNLVFSDPVAAMVEKEIRLLTRASRFRMVFVMGFSFGLIIWWPIAFGHRQHGPTFLSTHYVTVVSLYAVLLLSDVLFWNAFGFDRGAAQLYFVVPVRTRTVLLAKNISAMFFVLLETTIALAICAVVRLPVTRPGIAEAYAVTIVATVLLLAIGNITSLYSPRPVDPDKAFRSARSGRVQAMMLLIYPVVAIPLGLAYGARYAFDSDAAFYGVLAVSGIFGAILYRIAMDSAVGLAQRNRETILSTLSHGEGPIAG